MTKKTAKAPRKPRTKQKTREELNKEIGTLQGELSIVKNRFAETIQNNSKLWSK